MNREFAGSSEMYDSLHASAKDVRQACSEAHRCGAKVITEGDLSHCDELAEKSRKRFTAEVERQDLRQSQPSALCSKAQYW